LQKAIAILKCLEYASMYVHDGDHIDCDDVVSVALALIDDADDKLDSVMWRPSAGSGSRTRRKAAE
jgi:hypothetical protein